ncbi:hypothetical protein [Streptomyces sp. MS06]|uniref:hypothetical protein n=1 Tax=Streptomyces sp. MS06 TaxID=3385974 RepID=UPI00399F6489
MSRPSKPAVNGQQILFDICDTSRAQPQPARRPRARCNILDLHHQIPDSDIDRINDIHIALEGIL